MPEERRQEGFTWPGRGFQGIVTAMPTFEWRRRVAPAAVLLLLTVAAGCTKRERAGPVRLDAPQYEAGRDGEGPDAVDRRSRGGSGVERGDHGADGVGTVDTVPKTDEDWLKVRHGAVGLSEAANLLMMPGRNVARPHEKSETPGVELEPAEMQVLIDKDRAAFNQRAKALHEAGMAAVAAADAKDAQKLFEVGELIERACESCHSPLLVSQREGAAGAGRTAVGTPSHAISTHSGL